MKMDVDIVANDTFPFYVNNEIRLIMKDGGSKFVI
jgi:S-formylglutathione hydrolase FrmB